MLTVIAILLFALVFAYLSAVSVSKYQHEKARYQAGFAYGLVLLAFASLLFL